MHITVDFESIREMKEFCEFIMGAKTEKTDKKQEAVRDMSSVGRATAGDAFPAMASSIPGQSQAVVPTAAVNQPTIPTVPVQGSVPIQHPAQAQQNTVPTPQGVPTTQTTYTLDDLASAGVRLMESGRQGDLLGLLKNFGVEALPALPREQYGAFATALREMGAQI